MASQIPSSPFTANPVFATFLNVESLPKLSNSDDFSIDATTSLYDSSSADQALDDAEICHTISIIYNDIQSFKNNMPRRGAPLDLSSTDKRHKKRARTESGQSPRPRPKRRHDDDDAQSLRVERRRRDKKTSREREESGRRSGDREARKSFRKTRSSKESTRRASIIEESDDEIEPVLKISAHARSRLEKKLSSDEKNKARSTTASKLEILPDSNDDDEQDDEHHDTSAAKPKPRKARKKPSAVDDEHDTVEKDVDHSSLDEGSASDGRANDSERSLGRRKSSKSSRATRKEAPLELKVTKTAIAKKSASTGPNSGRRTPSQRKKQVKDKDAPPGQLRALGSTRKESSKHMRYTATMQKERDAMAADAAAWKAEGPSNTEIEHFEPIAPIQHILEFANSASNASKFNLERQKSFDRVTSRFTLAVIPNCDVFEDVDLMVYLVHTCEEHLKNLTDLCNHPERRSELNIDLDSLQCSSESDAIWSEAVPGMFISGEDRTCLPPLIKNTSDVVHVVFRIIEKVINHGGGDMVEKFYCAWYGAALSNLSGQLAWYAIELWDLLHGAIEDDQKSSRLVDWSLCLASITFLFEMRQLPSFPKDVAKNSLHLNLYAAKRPFDLPTAIRKGFKYLSKVGGFTRKGGSSFIDLVHSYFTALHCDHKKNEIVESVWNKVRCPDFASKLAKEDPFWSAVVVAPLSSALNRGRVHESNSEIAFAVALLRYAPTCRAVFMCESKAREVILSLMLRILKEMSRDLLSFFEAIWDHKKDFRDAVTADDLVKIILKFGFSQRELMYSSSEWRSEYLEAIRQIIMEAKKLAWLPLAVLATRIFYERGPFPHDASFSLECDSMPIKPLANAKEYDFRLYGFACLTWLIGSLGVSMEDGSHEISQANTMNFLLSRATSSRTVQQLLEMIMTVQLHVEKFIYPGTRKRSKKTELPVNVERMDLLTREERNKFFSVLNIVRLRVRELKGLGPHKFDLEEEAPVSVVKQEEGGLLQSMISGLKESTYLRKAAADLYLPLDKDPRAVKMFAETLRDDGQQLLARFDPSSDLSTRWVRLHRRNAYVGDARSQLTHGERSVGLPCTCVPGQTQSAAGEVLQLGCSNDMCENRLVKVECGPGPCGAGETCRNRRLQNMDYAKTKHKKVTDKGVGLFADEDIRPGILIGEYQGEVLSQEEFRNRKHDYRGERHFYFMTLTRNLVIDASRKSQITRFVNHSCDPNCVTEKWNAGGEPRVAIVSLRDIPKGEEITFDYGAHSVGLDSAPCLCGSSKCRGKLAAAKKAAQVKEADITMECVEEKDNTSVSADIKDAGPEVDSEDLQKYVDDRIAEGKLKIERAEKILQDLAGFEDLFEKSVDESKFDEKTKTKRAQRLADWKIFLERLVNRDDDVRDIASKVRDNNLDKSLPEVKASEGYRIPRLPQKPAGQKSDLNKVAGAHEKNKVVQTVDHVKDKQKSSRFSATEDFFADYRAKIRALQKPELDADGRPVNVDTHYVRGMNPAMTAQALELAVRSEPRVGPDADRHLKPLEPKQPKNSPFMPTKRTIKSKAEELTGLRRPIFAPRKRSGKNRNEDDSMDGYSTASSAEPVENYKFPEISDSDDDGPCNDEFVPAPLLESFPYDKKEREKFCRSDSRAPSQQAGDRDEHAMAPRGIGERALQDSRKVGQRHFVDTGKHAEIDDRWQRSSRNRPHAFHRHGNYHGSSHQETRARHSRFESDHQIDHVLGARGRAEDLHGHIYAQGVDPDQLPNMSDRGEKFPSKQTSSVIGSSKRERPNVENFEGPPQGHRETYPGQALHREKDLAEKKIRPRSPGFEAATKQGETEKLSEDPSQTKTECRDAGSETLDYAEKKVTKAGHFGKTSVDDPKETHLHHRSELAEPAAKKDVLLGASEPFAAQEQQRKSLPTQKPLADSSQGTVRLNTSFLGLRSKPVPLNTESDRINVAAPIQVKSLVPVETKLASSEKRRGVDLLNTVSTPETAPATIKVHLSPKDSKTAAHFAATAAVQLSAPETTQADTSPSANLDRQVRSVVTITRNVDGACPSEPADVAKSHTESYAENIKKNVGYSKPPEASVTKPGTARNECDLKQLEVDKGAGDVNRGHANESRSASDKRQALELPEPVEKLRTDHEVVLKFGCEVEVKLARGSTQLVNAGEHDPIPDHDKALDEVAQQSHTRKRDRSPEQGLDRSPKRRCSQSPKRSEGNISRRNDGSGVPQSVENSPEQRQSRVRDHVDGDDSERDRSNNWKHVCDTKHERSHDSPRQAGKRPNTSVEHWHGGEHHSHRRSRREHEHNFGPIHPERRRKGNHRGHNYRDGRADYVPDQVWNRQPDDPNPLNASNLDEMEHVTGASRERKFEARRGSGSAPLSLLQREHSGNTGREFQRTGHNEVLGGLRSKGMGSQVSAGSSHDRDVGNLQNLKFVRPTELQDQPGLHSTRKRYGRGPSYGLRNERHGGRRGHDRPREPFNRRHSTGGVAGLSHRGREQGRESYSSFGEHPSFPSNIGPPGGRPQHSGTPIGDDVSRGEPSRSRSRFSGSGGSAPLQGPDVNRGFGTLSAAAGQASNRQRSGASEQGRGSNPGDLRHILKGKGSKQ